MFPLDDYEQNPHPDMLHVALRIRSRAKYRPWDPESAAEWRGALAILCAAGAWTPKEINAWMDRAAPKAHRR